MWPLPPIHKSSAGHGRRAGLSGARRSGGRGLRRARRPQENKRATGASLRSCVRRSAAAGSGAGLALRSGGRAGAGWGGGAQTGRPAQRRAWGAEPLRGAGFWAPAAERPRTPAGFPGCADRELQRSAPAPGSCDLAALGATPSARLPISGRGAGLGSRQEAGERWPKERGALAPVGWASGGSRSPSGDGSGCHSLVAPFPPGPASPGRALRGVGWAGRGAGPIGLAAGPRRQELSLPPLSRAEPSRGA